MTRVLSILALMLLCAAPSFAAVTLPYTDNFEGNLTPNWENSASCSNPTGCNPSISMDVAHGGSKSLKNHYEFSCGMTTATGTCGTYINLHFGGRDEVFVRWWYRLASNWQTNGLAGSKILYIKSNSPDSWLMYFHHPPSSRSVQFRAAHGGWTTTCPNGTQDQECVYPANGGGGNPTIPLNTWTCVEIHVIKGTAGTNTGTLEAWVNDQLVLRYTNAGLATPAGGNSRQLEFLTQYAQLGNGDRYFDDLAVAGSRIGCGGTPPPIDTTPPSPPTGFTVQ